MSPAESVVQPSADVHAVAAWPAKSVNAPGFHPGPDGTWLKGFAVRELNQFHYDVADTVKLPAEDPAVAEQIKHTTQGVDAEPYTIVTGPQDWKAADYRGEENAHKWHYWLTPDDIEEIKAALELVAERGIKIEEIASKEEFPLPTLGPKLLAIRDEVVRGKGFHLIRGFPVDKFSRWQTVATYYAFGLWWGKPQAQNAKGHTIGHVKAIGTDPSLEGVRPYTTSTPHGYHSDNSDIVALLCLQDAQEGGISHWASSIAVHNKLLRLGRKDLVEALTTGEYWLPAHDVWGNPADTWDVGQPPHGTWTNQVPFIFHDKNLTVNFKEGAYYYSYKFPGAPRYTPLQEEALRTFTAIAKSDEFRLDWKLAPGDLPLLNNLSMLHAKSAFKDYADPAKGRHLLRLWVAAPNAVALPADSHYKKVWGSTEVGDRGGYWLGHSYVKSTPLDAEYGDLESTRPKAVTSAA